MSTKLVPFEKNNKYERIVAQLKEKVFSGEFRYGDRLPSEREMAETLNVSRLAVREAYKALQLFGMIEIRRGKQGGAFICSPSNQSIVQSISTLLRFQGVKIEEWTEARLLLEIDLAELAIQRANQNDCKRLEKIIADAEQKSQYEEVVHIENIQFHLSLAEVARNKILFTSYRSMMDLLLNSYLALDFKVDHFNVAQSHRHLLELLKGGAKGPFIEAIEAHVLAAGKNLLKISGKSLLFSTQTSI
jgi:GntR family transcriptional regulator, transcriptional repressor for pyruvate dehydrogenase complex